MDGVTTVPDSGVPPEFDVHRHTYECECLPIRVVVDQHGHYWRDYGDHWSMCPVSDENVATTPVTEFYRFGGDLSFADIEAEARASQPLTLDVDRLAVHEQALLELGRYVANGVPGRLDYERLGILTANVVNGLPVVRAALARENRP